MKNLEPILDKVPHTPSSRIPKPGCPSPKKVIPGKVTHACKPQSPIKRTGPTPATLPQSKVIATSVSKEHKPITKGKPLKLAFAKANAEKEATRAAAKQEHATEAKPLTKGEQLKLTYAKEKAEREAARAAAKHAHMSMVLPTAEEVMAEIKLETAARIKKRHEERDRVAQEKAKNEAAKSVASSAQSTSAGSADPSLTNAELIKLRMAHEAKRNEEERAEREAEREALRRKCVEQIRLGTWSPVASPAKQCESQPIIQVQATPEEIRSEYYFPRGLPRPIQSVIQVQAAPEEIRSEDYFPRGLPRPVPPVNQVQAAPKKVRSEDHFPRDLPSPIQSTIPKPATFTRKRSSCAISMPVPRQKKVVFELEYSDDDESNESPEPTFITPSEYSDGDESDESPEPTFITRSEPIDSPALLSHAEQVEKKNVETERAQNLADLKTQQRRRFGWVDKVIETRTSRQKFPPIVTGFEHLGIYVPDPRNGTPDRCTSSWGQYLTYPLDNVNMDVYRARHQAIQRCMAHFVAERKIRIKQYHFKHEYEHEPFEQHRGFKHDYLCIANTEGPLYNHHRTMSYRNSRFKHDPEKCWQCHFAKMPEIKIIWEEEDELQEDHCEEQDSCMIELYDEDGFLIEENVCKFEDAYEREEDFYNDEVGVYQSDVHTEEKKVFEIGKNPDNEGLFEVEDDSYEQNEINEQATAPDYVQEVSEMVECIEAETIPKMFEENQLIQVQERSSTQLIVLKAKANLSQAINISKIQPVLLKHIKSLSPSILARTTKVFYKAFRSIILTNSRDTAVKLPLQRYFSDLLIDLTRSHNCAHIASHPTITYLRVVAPTALVTSSATSSTGVSTITGLTAVSENGELTSAIKLLTQFAKENGITRGPVNIIKSWILNMPPYKQVVSCTKKVGKVIRRVFGYVKNARA